MKTPKTILRSLRGFTLIEMLVVIGIIAILATIAVPAGQMVLKKARELQAKAAMKGLEIAIKGYQTEYNRYPLAGAGNTEDTSFDTADSAGLPLLRTLLAQDTASNPRQIKFYDPSPAKNQSNGFDTSTGMVYDPWGEGYTIWIDYDGDGQLEDPYTMEPLATGILLYSAGADKILSVGDAAKSDDVKSW